MCHAGGCRDYSIPKFVTAYFDEDLAGPIRLRGGTNDGVERVGVTVTLAGCRSPSIGCGAALRGRVLRALSLDHPIDRATGACEFSLVKETRIRLKCVLEFSDGVVVSLPLLIFAV